jgi:uncharacterized membrane protein YhfC
MQHGYEASTSELHVVRGVYARRKIWHLAAVGLHSLIKIPAEMFLEHRKARK